MKLFIYLIAVLFLPSLLAQKKVLFIKGGSGTGGFISGGSDEQLSDIGDCSTKADNAGWGWLGSMLRSHGLNVEQREEGPRSNSGPADLSDLSNFDLVVFGSNNFGTYSSVDIDRVENFVKNGGKVLFISDAQFGSNWGYPPSSDQLFMDRFGLTMNQDSAQGPVTFQRSSNDYLVPLHPVLNGVDSITGEGTSFITVTSAPNATIIVRAIGNVRQNNGVNQGPLRPAQSNDACLVTVQYFNGLVTCFCDRNPFFNRGGAGGSLVIGDNLRFARNLFSFLLQANFDGPELFCGASSISVSFLFVLSGLALSLL